MDGDRTDPWEHDLWRVALGVPDEDVAVLWHATARSIPVERHYLEQDPDGGDATLMVIVSADTDLAAGDEAKRLYVAARASAGLAPIDPPVLGVLPPFLRDTLWHILFVEADTLAASGRNELAVVRAQTGLEVYAKRALEHVFIRRIGDRDGRPLARRCRVQLDRASVDLIAGITGERVTDEPWFDDYRKHLQRRNLVVHRGYAVSPADAHASLQATQACFKWLQQLWARS